MKFPGKRKSKHYFPITERGRIPFGIDFLAEDTQFVLGICQLIVDIQANVSEEFLQRFQLTKKHTNLIDDARMEEIYHQLKMDDSIIGEYPGGTVGNTLHNYAVLSESEAMILGTINQNIKIGDYAFKYLCATSSLVDLSHVQGVDGPMGRALCLITPDGERTFGLAPGKMSDLNEESIKESLVEKCSILVVSAYLLRQVDAPIFLATMKAMKLAKQHKIPVVMTLGSEGVIQEIKTSLIPIIEEYVNILAMNGEEAYALTGEKDTLMSVNRCLDLADLVLVTVGAEGLYLGSYCDQKNLRETKNPLIYHMTLGDYNQFEFSRGMQKTHCENPKRIFAHIDPFMGGPSKITNTSGAGDAALAALIHDIVSAGYHRKILPDSPKNVAQFLTYSSLSQICKYANRVSFEILRQNSPRLIKGLPDREDCLEEAYWEK